MRQLNLGLINHGGFYDYHYNPLTVTITSAGHLC
jgi:hypothetical protein